MAVWRAHLITDAGDQSEYCIENHICGTGWTLPDVPEREMEMLVPANYDFKTHETVALSAAEIKDLLHHGFFYASTLKVPFLNDFEVERLRRALSEKYMKLLKKK